MKNIIIIGALVLVAAGSWWALTKDAKTTDMAGTESMDEQVILDENTSTDETDEVTGKGSLLSLLALGKSQECSFVVRADGMVQEGTAFYDGGNARVDTLISGAGTEESIASYMIMDQDSNTMYLWSSAQDGQGVKMAIPETDVSAESDVATQDTMNQGVPPDVDVDYTCKPWQVDGSVFVPPASVEFMDMTEMQRMMESMGGMEGMTPRP